MSCCPEHKPCGKNLGCLNQVDSKCVFLNDCDLAALLNVSCGDNLENVIEALINLQNSGITANLGSLCINGGDPFDINTWLENAEERLCDLNPIVDITLGGPVITFEFYNGDTIDIDLGPLLGSLPGPTMSTVQDTVFVDSIYGDDGTGLREDRAKPFQTIAGAIGAMVEDDIIHVINSSDIYNVLGSEIQSSSISNFRIHLEQGTSLAINFSNTGYLDFDGKTIEIVGREGGDNLVVLANTTPSSDLYHNFNLHVKNVETVVSHIKLRSDCQSSWENIETLEIFNEALIFSDTIDSPYIQSGDDGTHEFISVENIQSLSVLARLDALASKTYVIDIDNSKANLNNLIRYNNSIGTDYLVNLNIENSTINVNEDTFDVSVSKRNSEAYDSIKNTKITSSAGTAYGVSDEHQGSIEMINVRLEGQQELAIDQTTLSLVDAKLQDVWSNQYPSNAMTTREPQIEHIHVDGEDGTKSITFAQSPYTMGPESTLLVDSTSGDVIINFPKADRVVKEITLIGTGGANNMIITPDGAETINGVASKAAPTLGTTIIKVKSDRLNLYGWATISI